MYNEFSNRFKRVKINLLKIIKNASLVELNYLTETISTEIYNNEHVRKNRSLIIANFAMLCEKFSIYFNVTYLNPAAKQIVLLSFPLETRLQQIPNTLSRSLRMDLRCRERNHEIFYTLKEVSFHDTSDDCWLVIYDRIYNVTEFLAKHPGGWEILLEYAGKDASLAFRGTGHSENAVKMLEKYCIGILPVCERIFRKKDGFRVSGIPD